MSKKKLNVRDEDFKKMVKVPHKKNKYVDNSFHFYFSYFLRILLMFGSIIVIGLFSYNCFKDSFTDGVDENLFYEEEGNATSNYVLLENNLFDTGQLTPDGSYISDVIDDISTDFSYYLKFDKKVDIKYSYNVVATMMLNNSNGDGGRTKNEYPLVPKESNEIIDTDVLDIKKNITLDYDYYNKLANTYKEQYGSINGIIDIKMNIKLEIDYNKFDDVVVEEKNIVVEIPLLSNEVIVNVKNKIDNKDNYVEHHDPVLKNKFSLYSGVSLLILDTIFVLLAISFLFRVRSRKSKYCVLRDGLLRDYDKIIVNSKKMPKLSEFNIIDCYSFSELMDAQRLLGKPIVYYEIIKNQKCIFVLIGDNDIYTFTLKECDIDY